MTIRTQIEPFLDNQAVCVGRVTKNSRNYLKLQTIECPSGSSPGNGVGVRVSLSAPRDCLRKSRKVRKALRGFAFLWFRFFMQPLQIHGYTGNSH